MSAPDLAALRALAEKATPGPWAPDAEGSIVLRVGTEFKLSGCFYHWDAAYIAAAHPGAVLALLDEVERLRGALVALADAADVVGEKLHIVQPYLSLYKKHGDTIAAARAEAGQ